MKSREEAESLRLAINSIFSEISVDVPDTFLSTSAHYPVKELAEISVIILPKNVDFWDDIIRTRTNYEEFKRLFGFKFGRRYTIYRTCAGEVIIS